MPDLRQDQEMRRHACCRDGISARVFIPPDKMRAIFDGTLEFETVLEAKAQSMKESVRQCFQEANA